MNRIILIGNGFDLAHGLKTSYKDFIDDYWEKKLNAIITSLRNRSNGIIQNGYLSQRSFDFIYEDNDISIVLQNYFDNLSAIYASQSYAGYKKFFSYISLHRKNNENNENNVRFKNLFLDRITSKVQLHNWVDIEEEYYNALIDCIDNVEKATMLNEDFHSVRIALETYLKSQDSDYVKKSRAIEEKIYTCIPHGNRKRNLITGIMDNFLYLSFNYTNTERLYTFPANKKIHIHGELDNPKNPIIFGYGDEIGEKYKIIEQKNENCYLENIKSIKYSETKNYREMLDFINLDKYQVFVMGHSCGISDRTLLNILFEHKNCFSIKVFYHTKKDGTDNHSDVIRNISRNFTNKNLFRERIVAKEDSEPLSS